MKLKRSLPAVAVAFALSLSACSDSEQVQLDAFVKQLETAGFTIDTVENGKNAPLKNARWETEKETKTRKVNGKSVKVTKGTRVMEVVVVLAGNCKAEFERVKDGDPKAYFFDEIRAEDGGELGVDPNFDGVDTPDPAKMKRYFDDRKDAFVFCYNKPFKLSKN